MPQRCSPRQAFGQHSLSSHATEFQNLTKKPARSQRRIFVLDTNVLMHDPAAIFRFEEHDIYIPMIVLEELDAGKKGLSEAARNVRQVSRFLDELMDDATKAQIDHGLELPNAKYVNGGKKPRTGQPVLSDALACVGGLPDTLPGHGADNAILGQTLALQKEYPRRARHAGVEGHQPAHQGLDHRRAGRGLLQRQDHRRCGLLYTGMHGAAGKFLGEALARTWNRGRSTRARSTACAARRCATGSSTSSCISRTPNGIEALVREIDGKVAVLELMRDFRSERHSIWGITARNREQNFALNLLLDPEIDFVTDPRSGGHRQDAADAGRGPGADAREQPLHRNHHDARDDSARRRHRLSARHGRGKDGAVDGRADGQSRGADAEPGRRQLGTGGNQRSAAQSHQDPLAQFHARSHIPQPLHDPR